jgi:hypothetical protein
MARTLADLPPGSRVTHCIGLDIIAKYFPPAKAKVYSILKDSGMSERNYDY